ncbi:hypothetical protein ACFY2W_36095 [Streptomyces sp. NPDC001262]|uniref:hypothetical protein n=1 Tax=Streptomyces sp. NPDC001262 TaxID=3364552 RepID=UPI0036C55277
MTTRHARTASPAAPTTGREQMDREIEALRVKQTGPDLVDQRHMFLHLDPHLVRDDYTRPAPQIGGER